MFEVNFSYYTSNILFSTNSNGNYFDVRRDYVKPLDPTNL